MILNIFSQAFKRKSSVNSRSSLDPSSPYGAGAVAKQLEAIRQEKGAEKGGNRKGSRSPRVAPEGGDLCYSFTFY